MSWLWALALFWFAFASSAEATRKTQLPASVVGTVYCHTCSQNDFSEFNRFISGALVAVECDGTQPSSRFRKEVKTNKHGQFKVKLPFSVTKHVKNIKKCSVNLISSNDANCAVASTARTSSFRLKTIQARTCIFSAGFLTFKPLTQPNICNKKPNINENSKDSVNNDPSSFPPPLQDPPSSIIPPIDNPGQFTPLPILPRLPPLPELPNLPPILPPKQATHTKTSSDLKNQKTFFPFPPTVPNPFQPPLVPNPLQPPPALVPPVIPSPPPSLFPPVFPSPPPSIFPPVIPAPPVSPPSFFPPIPGFSHPASPPPPVIPFLPPGFPGVPPATTSSHSKETKHP
ncbi:uncharacterized protein LOC141661870 [Apium graveolens]|uniref:uncharacterized protein LOC141661870 n=1 Tax=Apium graveolens TaxID=4045 RepID=UPI003D79F5BE